MDNNQTLQPMLPSEGESTSAGEAVPTAAPSEGSNALGASTSLPNMELPSDERKTPAVDAREVKRLVDDEMVAALWKRADKAQERLSEAVHSLRMGIQLLDLIKSARSELLAGKDHYVKAERFVNEVEFQLSVRENVLKLARRRGFLLSLYEFVAAALFFAIFFLWAGVSSPQGPTDLMSLVACMCWGGLGGVMGAWFSLLKHVAMDQDFDPQHTLWYISSPIMGLGVGGVVFVILRAGLLSLGTAGDISSPFILYVLAWLAGYQHNLFTEIVKRLLKVFKVEEETRQ